MRLRLFLSFALIGLVSVASVLLIAGRNNTRTVRLFMTQGGIMAPGGLADTLTAYYENHGSWDGVGSLFSTAGRRGGHGMSGGPGNGMVGMMNQRLRLSNAYGKILIDTASSPPAGFLSNPERADAIKIQVKGKTVGFLLAERGMAANRREEAFLVNRLRNAALTAGLIAIGLGLLLSMLLTYGMLRPVRELTSAAKKLGEGDLSQRVSVNGDNEISILANTFNTMADSLQKAEDSRKALMADIAHELRNPLALQRANLEAIQDGIFPLNEEGLSSVLEQNKLLTRLVDDLRTLALADAGELKLEVVPTDIYQLVQRNIVQFRPQAARRDIDVILEKQDPIKISKIVWVDPFRFDQVLGNLLSNALRYTPNGGQICLRIESNPDMVEIYVHDSGPGIESDALPHIFEKFYRGDRSRSRSEGGSGLGLAIARKLVETHGGTLTAENHPDGGALFKIALPANK